MKVVEIYSSLDEVLITGIVMEQGEPVKIIHGSLSLEGDLIVDTISNQRNELSKRYQEVSQRDNLIQTFIAQSYKTIHQQIKSLTENRIREVLRNERIIG